MTDHPAQDSPAALRADAEAVPPVLLLGEPGLRVPSLEVACTCDEEFVRQSAQLHRRLNVFRTEHGFGRAISAPQIGVNKRFIALNLAGVASTMVNPVVTWRSRTTFELWDDCMSFPDLLVRVVRHRSISVVFEDETGRRREWSEVSPEISELLQHEIDHLDGILAIDRAAGPGALVSRAVFERDRARFTP